MKIIDYSDNGNKLICKTEEYENCFGLLEFIPVNENILRVRYTTDENFCDKESLTVVANVSGCAGWESEYDKLGEKIIYKSSTTEVHTYMATGKSEYFYNGELKFSEREEDSKIVEKKTIKVPFYPDNQQNSENPDSGKNSSGDYYVGIDGLEIKSECGLINYRVETGFATRLCFDFSEDEAVFGLGQHEDGIMNYRGKEEYLFQHNLKIAIPVIISSRNYGIFFDHCSAGIFRDNQHGSYMWNENEYFLDYYFIPAGNFDEIIKGIRYLTGKASMLPKWTFGYIQSKEHYHTADEILSTALEYRKRNVPLDCVVQDWLSWDLNCWGNKEFDCTRYPEPEKMIDTLHKNNVHYMHSIWPSMKEGGQNHKQMKETNGFYANNYTYNPFKESTRKLYWEQLKHGIFNKGADAWWCDCTEPFKYDWGLKHRPDVVDNFCKTVSEFNRNMDPKLINAYSLMHSAGIYNGQYNDSKEKRVVNLIRSSFPGQQKYGTIAWSGDISARWDVLKKSIASGLNFCITGLPYWTLDIGAFFVKNNPKFWSISGDYDDGCKDLGYRELYTRWSQFAAFLPMMRSHGTDTPREIWQFGDEGEIFYESIKKIIKLRYRLLPYIYSLAGCVWFDDYTMYRALAFDFNDDSLCRDIDNQFMLGKSLMVCPVTRPMYYHPKSVPVADAGFEAQVYLPSTCNWYSFPQGESYSGGQMVSVNAPIDEIPLFVPEGAILILGPEIQFANENPQGLWELHIFTGRGGNFKVYEDSGDGYGYESGEYIVYNIFYLEEESKVLFGDFYNGMDYQYKRKFNVYLNGKMVAENHIYEGGDDEIYLENLKYSSLYAGKSGGSYG